MFFDAENCRTIRVLHEISGFLEASIEKLLELEKEAVKELEKEKSKQSESFIVKIKEEPVVGESLQNNKETNCTAQVEKEVSYIAKPTNDSGAKHLYTSNDSASKVSNVSGQAPFQRKNDASTTEKNCEKRNLDSLQLDLSRESRNDQKKIRKSPDNLLENVIIKKELDSSYSDNCSTFRAETSASVLDHLNKSSCNNFPPQRSHNINVKKEPESPKKNNTSSTTLHGNNEKIENLKKIKPRSIPETGIVFRENDFYKARIRFKKSFTWTEVKKLLTSAGVQDIEDIALVDKNAIVTFFSNEKLQALLSLNTDGLKKIRAFSVEPFKKYTVIEEKEPVKRRSKKHAWRKQSV